MQNSWEMPAFGGNFSHLGAPNPHSVEEKGFFMLIPAKKWVKVVESGANLLKFV
jgi:hypothetical protein